MSTYPIKKVKQEQRSETSVVNANKQERKSAVVGANKQERKSAVVSASKERSETTVVSCVRKPHRYKPGIKFPQPPQPPKREYVAPPPSEYFIPHNIPLIDVPPDFTEKELPTKQSWCVYDIFRNGDYDLLCKATTKIAAMQWVQIYRNNSKDKIDVFIGNRDESPELFEGIVIEEHKLIDEISTEYVIK